MNESENAREDVEMSTRLLDDDSKEQPAAVAMTAESPKGLRKQVIDVACIMLNITSTVTLVFLNKWYVCEREHLHFSLYPSTCNC